MTATEKRHLLIQLPLVFAQFLFEDEIHDMIFILYVRLLKWYEIIRRPQVSEDEISEMNDAWTK